MKEKKCYFCGKILIGGSNHIYSCARKKNILNKKEIKYLQIIFNFPELQYDVLKKLYVDENNSLPDIQKLYGIDFKSILYLLEYYKIDKRSAVEGCLIGASKSKISLFKKHGVINVGQLEEVKEKRKKTCIEKYGVDNIYKYKPFYDYVKRIVEIKYGCSLSELQSKLSKKSWSGKTYDEKINWLNNSIMKANTKGGCISKLEKKFQPILNELNITYTTQFSLRRSSTKIYRFDYFINDYNLIIEINGDYWHANPLFYKKNDMIRYRKGFVKANVIWKMDYEKKLFAKKNGYDLIYIWESEMKNIDLSVLLLNKLNEYENSKNKID